MIVIPEDYEIGRFLQHTRGAFTLTYMNHERQRLQISRSLETFTAFWTPGDTAGSCLRRLHTSAVLAYTETSFEAEFSNGRKISTLDWKPALEEVTGTADADLRSVEFKNSGGRAIMIASLGADSQLDIGITAELSLLSTLRDSLFLTGAPRAVKLAFNTMLKELFYQQFARLHIRVDSPIDKLIGR